MYQIMPVIAITWSQMVIEYSKAIEWTKERKEPGGNRISILHLPQGKGGDGRRKGAKVCQKYY